MSRGEALVVAIVVVIFYYLSYRETRRADEMEEERDILFELLVAGAHEKAEWE